ncbi:MAG: lysine transporter LysE [Methanobacteriota archaeon]|nr:MAG: lysine transporter LysE [Euryarchaeota archaeon]PXY78530.1 MAG: lysine transporter LysE [Euryarchaeota archaeon]HIA25456.1 LysE family translocator [Candidatus Poseidoniales archaeon]HIO86516.1 LysE family translocator [Candidatus Poseidoniales archaeon]
MAMAVDVTSLIPVAFVLAGGAMSPGPSLAVVIRNTIAGGRSRGIACSIGHGLGLGIYVFLAISGIAFLKSGGGSFSTILELAGGAFLIWVAISMLRASGADGKKVNTSDGVELHGNGKRQGFVEGFLIAIFNPKIFVFLTAIFSQFIAAGMPLSDRLIITCLALVIDTSWYIIVASALSGTPLLEALKQRARLIDIVVAIILLGLAITIFAKYLM